MKIIFYKASKGRLLDKLIAFWTLGKYSHVEIVYEGVAYSSSSRDGGVRRKIIDDFETSGKWDIFDIKIDPVQLQFLYHITQTKKYDWVGIFLSELIKFNIQSKNRWYCSEWIAFLYNMQSKNKIKTNISPNKLYKKFVELKLIEELK
jgi:hypothetical protein